MKTISSSVWSRPLCSLALLGTLALPSFQAHADTATATTSQVSTVAGKLMVRFKPGISSQEKSRVLAQVGGVLKRTYSTGWALVQVPQSSTQAALKKLKALPQVVGAEPDYQWKIERPLPSKDAMMQLRSSTKGTTPSDNIPNDPRFPQQWALQQVGAPEAWKTTTGSKDVVIADMDSGINLTHKDLIPNLFTNTAELNGKAGVDDDKNGFVDDVHGWNGLTSSGNVQDTTNGHGSLTAGIIGAAGNNKQLISGVNWQVTVVPVATFSDSFSGDSMAQGADYILALRKQGVNVRAVNCSFGGPQSPPLLALYDSFKALNDAGVLIVCAVGNDNTNADQKPFFPACFDLPNIISVGATNYTDDRAFYSNYGVKSVDIFAPGDDILSTFKGSPTALTPSGGTSMAAPMVTGAAALLWAAQPSLSAAQVKQRILASAKRVDQLCPFVKEGRRLDVGALLNNATHTISGRTTTFDGKMRSYIGGVSIFLDDHTGTPDAITNDTGSYLLPVVAGGSHTVRAELDGKPFGNIVKVNLPTGKSAAPTTVKAYFEKTTSQSKRYAIYGHVDQDMLRGQYKPKPNVDVYLNDSKVPFARSDAKGNFKISNLAEGSYAVRLIDSQTGEKALFHWVVYLPLTQPKDDYANRYSPDGYVEMVFSFSDRQAPDVYSTNFNNNPSFTPQTMPKFFTGFVTDQSPVDSMAMFLFRSNPSVSTVELYDVETKQWLDFWTFGYVPSGVVEGNGQTRLPFKLPLPSLELGYDYWIVTTSSDMYGNQVQKPFSFVLKNSSTPSTKSAPTASKPSAGNS